MSRHANLNNIVKESEYDYGDYGGEDDYYG